MAFMRVLWRVCRGNVFVKHAQIDETLEDPVTVSVQKQCCAWIIAPRSILCQGNPVMKSVFILFFQGEQLHARIRKLCEGYVLY